MTVGYSLFYKIPIGGYFSLELPKCEEYHKDAIKLNTGRNCLEYILRARKYDKVYIPHYTCEVVLEPFKKLNISYEFYHINLQFEITDDIQLKKGEALLYTNYFGLKQRYVEQLAELYGSQLIVDNTQAFYAKPISGIDSFYTCRKFFGVPDGAYIYTDKRLDEEFEQDVSYDRMSCLTKRIDLGAEAGYADFRGQSERFVGQPIRRMSNLTQRLMLSIDYEKAANQRRENYQYLHQSLHENNGLSFPLEKNAVPMVYPYLIGSDAVRQHLIKNKIFVARYWPNVLEWCQKMDLEYELTTKVIPLPIDQRYGENEMDYIIKIIKDGR